MNRQQRRQVRRQEAAGNGDGDGASEIDVEVPLVEEGFDDGGAGGDGGGGLDGRSGGRSGGSESPGPRQHTGPRQFLHEVNVEMRKVAWPTRAETLNYSTVVFITLAILMALIFVLDLGFTHVAGFLFNP
jgi:preprotein translocase subunit SecE